MSRDFDVLIVVAEKDFPRLKNLYHRLPEYLQCKKLIFVGNRAVGQMANELDQCEIGWIDEDSILPFQEVHELMKMRLAGILNGQELPRGITGWYYQQFLKMRYSFICEDDYYMTWDGDTVPCRPIHMFKDGTGEPYLDLKTELKQEYFDTMGKLLPGMRKVIEKSFISEHMLFRKDIMQDLIGRMEANSEFGGTQFWEKILYAISPEQMQEGVFSEFETYGTFAALNYMTAYRLREWHSFRLGAEFFDPQTISERDFIWLGRDFDAISFEKNQSVREDHKNLFDNPKYQEKLSARQMLQVIQPGFNGGYVEVWDDNSRYT